MLFRAMLVLLVGILNTAHVAHSESNCKDRVQVSKMALSSDMAYLAVGDSEHSVQIWNVKTGKKVNSPSLATEFLLNTVSFSDDGKQLLLGGLTEAVLWDIETGKQIATFPNEDHKIGDPIQADFIPNSKYIITIDPSGASFWDEQSFKKVFKIPIKASFRDPVDISRDGKYLLIEGENSQWQLWNIETLQNIYTFDPFFGAHFTPDSKYIVYYGSLSGIVQWDIEAKKTLRILISSDKDSTDRLDFSLDNRYFALYDQGVDLSIWNLQKGTQIYSLEHTDQLQPGWKFLPNNEFLLLLSSNYTATTVGTVWTIKHKKRIEFETTRWVTAFTVTPDGSQLFAGFDDGSIELWSLRSGKKISSFMECH